MSLCAQVMWRRVERPIAPLNRDRRSSLKSRGTQWNQIGRRFILKTFLTQPLI